MKKNLLAAMLVIAALPVFAQTLDTSFPASLTSSQNPEGAVIFPDGKVLIYGAFQRINGDDHRGVLKFNSDGSIDNTFDVGTGPNNEVLDALIQPDGKILLAGRFTTFNGVNRTGLIRLNADGSVDNTFSPNITLSAAGTDFNLALQSDGKILLNASMIIVDGTAVNTRPMVRFNTNGSRDATFTGPTFASQIQDIAVQSDGKILVAGSFTKGIDRLNANGSDDTSFDPGTTGFNSTVRDIEVTSGGIIYAAGVFASFNGDTNYKSFVSLTSTGAVNASYQANGKFDQTMATLHLLADGKLLVGGFFSKYGTTNVKSPARLNTDGSLDNTFDIGTGGNTSVDFVSANASGEIVIVGSSALLTTFDGQAINLFARLEADGDVIAPAETMEIHAAASGNDLAVLGDKILVGHRATTINGVASTGFARLNLDGTYDATFAGNSKPNNQVAMVTVDSDERILIGGAFTQYDGTPINRIARLTSAGALDATFTTNIGTGLDDAPLVVVEQPDGKLLVGGGFTTVNGTARELLCRLNEDGTLDPSFNTANGFFDSDGFSAVYDIEILSTGKILVAGEFEYDVDPAEPAGAILSLVRLNSDGSLDETFLIGAGVTRGINSVSAVYAVEELSNGKILIGGSFDKVDGAAASYLEVLNSDGTLDNSYTLNSFFIVDVIAKQSDGKFLILDRNTGIRRLNSDGTVDASFTNIPVEVIIDDLEFMGNDLIITGTVTEVQGQGVLGIARIDMPDVPAAPSALAATAVAQTSVSLSWAASGTTETGYYVERSVGNNTNYQVIATLNAATTTYNNTGLTSSTSYYYRVRAFNTTGPSAYSNELNVTTLIDPPTAPSGLSFTNVSASALQFSWTDNSATETGFEIYRSPNNNTNFVLLTTTGSNVTAHSDATVTPETLYFYKVRAINAGGNSAYTPEISKRAQDAPTAPSAFAVAVVDATELELSWTDNSSNESGFEIYRSPNNNANYTLLTTIAGNETSYTDEAVTAETLYFYKVRAINDGGHSAFTAEDSAIPQNPPNAPSFLEVTSVSSTEIEFDWHDNSNNEFGFEIFRSENDNTDFQLLIALGPNVTVYADAAVTAETRYFYKVRSYNGGGASAFTSEVARTAQDPPAAPTLDEVNVVSGSELEVVWTDNSNNESHFDIFRSIDGSPFEVIATVPANTTTYADETAIAELQHQYMIEAVNDGGTSPTSGIMTAVPQDPPAAPSDLVATSISSTSISLSWTDNANNETTYALFRAKDNISTLALLIALGPDITTYTDESVEAGATYIYMVRALNNSWFSGFANDLVVIAQDAPAPPSGLAISAISASELQLTWIDNSPNETGFEVYRSVNDNTDFQSLATVGVGATTFSDETVVAGTTYFYVVRAVNASGPSAFSAETSAIAQAPPAPPTAFQFTSRASDGIAFSWTDNSNNELGFYIFRSDGDDTDYQLLTSVGANVTSYMDAAVTEGTAYYYRVSAFNPAGSSTSVEGNAVALDVPDAPSELEVTVVDANALLLSWTDNSDNEDGFDIFRSEGNNSSYAFVTTVNAGVTTFQHGSVVAGTEYFYKVRSFNVNGQSDFSNEASAVPADPAPAIPTNLQAIVLEDGNIELTWTDNSNDETGFEIEKAEGTGTFSLIHTTASNVTGYVDADVTPATEYHYRLRAINGTYSSEYTAPITATPPPPGPTAPADLTISSPTPTSLMLDWSDKSDDEEQFLIERSVNAADFSQIASVAANTTGYHDTNLAIGQTYYYRVSAANDEGTSAFVENSGQPGVYDIATSTTLTLCEGFLLDAGRDADYSDNEDYTTVIHPGTTGMQVRLTFESFSLGSGDLLSVYDGTSAATTLISTYSGTTIPGTITASNAAGALTLVFHSDASGTSSGWKIGMACTVAPIESPSSLLVEVTNESETQVSWTDNSFNETGFTIERSTGSASSFVEIGTVAANTTAYSDNDVTTNTTYYYRVKASGALTDSDYTPTEALAYGKGGLWRLKTEFDGIARTDAVGFALDDKGYIGLGWAGGAQANNFRAYDPATDSWSTIASFGGLVRSEASAFVIGDKAYVGLGEWFDPERDLWEYDPVANSWTQKADFGGTGRTGAIGFAIGDKGYFGLGRDDSGYTNDVWQYDPSGDSWTEVASFPGDARNGAVVFVIGDAAYAGSGYNGSSSLNDFYKYDPAANSWTPIAGFPGVARRHAVAFTIDGKGYVGTGDAGSDRKDFWIYDPVTNTWEEIVSFGGTARFAGTSFGLNGKGYVGTGFDGSERKDLWELTPAAFEPAPVAPSDLSAAALSATGINLNWTDNSVNENAFVIERSVTNSSNFQYLTSVAANVTTYTDNGLDPETTYYYRVKITTATVGGSGFSNIASATTLGLPPTAPSGLVVALGAGTDPDVELSWSDNSSNENGFVIERSTGTNANFETLTVTLSDVVSFTDESTASNTTYFYRVKATNNAGDSGYSNESSVTTPPSLLPAPSNLVGQALSPVAIQLNWSDNSNDETSFTIIRSTLPSSGFQEIATPAANAAVYVDETVEENTTYYYAIRANKGTEQSSNSATISVTTPLSIPLPPVNVDANYDDVLNAIYIDWTIGSFNTEDYIIQRSFNGTDYTELAVVSSAPYTDEDPGTTFQVFYRVAARNAAGTSAFSAPAHVIITGVGDFGEPGDVKTYPNPAVDLLNIEIASGDAGTLELTFFDMTGRTVLKEAHEKGSEQFVRQIGTKPFAGNSIIFVKVALNNKVVVRKIVLK